MNKKVHYLKSQEIATLFGTTIDTLRYYEKIGLLHPIRNPENNYRYFTIQDVETLRIVMELLKLHFPLSEIKTLVTTRTTQNTLSLLHQEENCLKEQIAELTETLKNLQARIAFMHHILDETPVGEIQIQNFPERKCIRISDTDIAAEDFEIAVMEYTKETSCAVPLIGASDCYATDIEEYKLTGILNVKRIYYYTTDSHYDFNDSFPAGTYLTLAFHLDGQKDFACAHPYMNQLLDYVEKHHLTPLSDIYSFFMIDGPESSIVEEHIVELQLRIH